MSDSKTDDLIFRLENLGVIRTGWGTEAGIYFSYHNGRVEMPQVREFFNYAVGLTREAAEVITTLTESKGKK